MPQHQMFAWALQGGSAVALNYFLERSRPKYLPIRVDQLASLAEGRTPPRE